LKPDEIGLAQDSIGLAGLEQGERVQIRALRAPTGDAKRLWQERLEAVQ
jgi:hypothetical protein